MKTSKKSARAAQIKNYWEKMEACSESALNRVQKKFGLRFSTLVMDRDPSAEGQKAALDSEPELVGLAAEQDDHLGWATFYFYF